MDIHNRIWGEVKSYWEANEALGHGTDHAQRVYNHAIYISQLEGANAVATGVASYLVDVGLNFTAGREGHVERSLEIAEELLSDIPELRELEKTILTAIQFHEIETQLPPFIPIEAKVVRDSETLDRMGFTGIRMTLNYGTWKCRPLYNPDDPLCRTRRPELDNFSMDYVRHIFNFEEHLVTYAAKAIGRKKIKEMHEYCSKFEALHSIESLLDYTAAFDLLGLLQGEN